MIGQRFDHPQAEVVVHAGRSMGGELGIRVLAPPGRTEAARRDIDRVARRIDAWAARLTRFSPDSDLSRLNATSAPTVAVRPTLGAALSWGAAAEDRTGGVVDVTLLDARLAAEAGTDPGPVTGSGSPRMTPSGEPSGRWSIEHGARKSALWRAPGVRFDLDGVAKGWIADRALALLERWPAAIVDADGDVAVGVSPGCEWPIEIENPFDRRAEPLATLRIAATGSWRETAGVATSGTTVHRWGHDSIAPRHHLIDPRTRRPARTDLVQATVAAPTAAEAEVLAKSAVILGSHAGATFLERSNASFALLLREDGSTIGLGGDARSAAA